jgi:hypothetical protein
MAKTQFLHCQSNKQLAVSTRMCGMIRNTEHVTGGQCRPNAIIAQPDLAFGVSLFMPLSSRAVP